MRYFLSNSSGSTAISAAILALPLFLSAGLAIDYAVLVNARNSLQDAADAAALASAKELSLTSTKDTTVKTVAMEYVHASLEERVGLEDDVQNVKIGADVSQSRRDVTVDISYDWKPMFIQYFNKSALPIKVRATASLAGEESICVVALDGASNGALAMTGESSIAANGCAIYSNSKNPNGIGIVTGAAMRASTTYSGGGFAGPLNGYQPRPVTDSPVVPDPLVDRAKPSFPPCTEKNAKYTKGDISLSPCVFEGGLTLTGKTDVMLKSGIYVIKDGPLSVGGNSTIRGENVGFYFEGKNATFDFGVSTQVDLTAPETGSMAGILFFEDRNSPVDREFVIRSKDAERFEGTVYLPKGKLVVDKASRVGQRSNWTAIIAKQIEIKEGPSLEINSNYANSNIPVPEGVGPNGTPRLTR